MNSDTLFFLFQGKRGKHRPDRPHRPQWLVFQGETADGARKCFVRIVRNATEEPHMTLADLLTTLDSLGVRLSARGDALHYRAPPGALTPELRAALVHASSVVICAASSIPAR